MRKLSLGMAGVCLLVACQPRPPKPTLPSQPKLDRTFGDIRLETDGLSIAYKSIRLSINDLPSALSADYVFLSTLPSTLNVLRKDQKILVLPSLAVPAKQKGFLNVKGLEPGRIIQLTKQNDFLFARALAAAGDAAPQPGLFMEFDNGRNILSVDHEVIADAARPFLLGLRDEGKEIHIGFFTHRSALETAELVALFQPQLAVVRGTADKATRQALAAALKGQLFEGTLLFPKPGETIPF